MTGDYSFARNVVDLRFPNTNTMPYVGVPPPLINKSRELGGHSLVKSTGNKQKAKSASNGLGSCLGMPAWASRSPTHNEINQYDTKQDEINVARQWDKVNQGWAATRKLAETGKIWSDMIVSKKRLLKSVFSNNNQNSPLNNCHSKYA
ncbi:unnamed protein product [Protopolystoma xenopodis]|uniref:Uncharacterized protein n=1 Tax=Protopolystoma xenopodis TaxID=117903 RepID=A0A3S5B320_9PLAT|nr:unnamed protein product [Protopolystoma xenopodis]